MFMAALDRVGGRQGKISLNRMHLHADLYEIGENHACIWRMSYDIASPNALRRMEEQLFCEQQRPE